VGVWYFETAAMDAAAVDAASAILSPDERTRAHRFFHQRDRRDYVAAHALARRALSLAGAGPPAALIFSTAASGKPRLIDETGAPSPLHFSLSHTRGLVACAVSPGAAVGVDAECLDRGADIDAVAGRFFASAEVAHLNQLTGDARMARFFELWTLKEALLKAIGLGLSHPLNQIAFEITGPDAISLAATSSVDPQAWQFALSEPVERYRVAVAVETGGATVRVRFQNAAALMAAPADPGTSAGT
jgi:4'-phosphopantetheinyl transferase